MTVTKVGPQGNYSPAAGITCVGAYCVWTCSVWTLNNSINKLWFLAIQYLMIFKQGMADREADRRRQSLRHRETERETDRQTVRDRERCRLQSQS